MKRIISFLILIGLIYLGVGYYFYIQSIGFDTQKNRDLKTELSQAGLFDLNYIENLPQDTFLIHSNFDYNLHSILLFNPQKTNKFLIINHGIGRNKWEMMKFVKPYMQLGFNILLYDLRNHGLSGGKSVTYGYFEHQDLQSVVEYVEKKYNPKILGVHGESLGAATSVMHAKINERYKMVDFYVFDCPYSDIKQLFKYRLKEDYGLPDIGIVLSANLINKIKNGFSFSEINPLKAIQNATTPALFIHGKNDTFIPCYMSEAMYAQKPGKNELYLVEKAEHALSFATDKDTYFKRIQLFLSQIGMYNN